MFNGGHYPLDVFGGTFLAVGEALLFIGVTKYGEVVMTLLKMISKHSLSSLSTYYRYRFLYQASAKYNLYHYTGNLSVDSSSSRIGMYNDCVSVPMLSAKLNWPVNLFNSMNFL